MKTSPDYYRCFRSITTIHCNIGSVHLPVCTIYCVVLMYWHAYDWVTSTITHNTKNVSQSGNLHITVQDISISDPWFWSVLYISICVKHMRLVCHNAIEEFTFFHLYNHSNMSFCRFQSSDHILCKRNSSFYILSYIHVRRIKSSRSNTRGII